MKLSGYDHSAFRLKLGFTIVLTEFLTMTKELIS